MSTASCQASSSDNASGDADNQQGSRRSQDRLTPQRLHAGSWGERLRMKI
jgi:hypothetical protein